MSWADHVARDRIRQAQERGDFDDLPMAGRPLDLGDPHDPHWWVRRYLERNGVSPEDVMPAPLALRREAEGFPQSLSDLPSAAAVREVLEDFNRRVRLDWLTPTPVPMPHARVVDVESLVGQWQAARRRGQPGQTTPVSTPPGYRRSPRSGPLRWILRFVKRRTLQ